MAKPDPIDPKEFSEQGDLVLKAQYRLGRAQVAFQKAQKELNVAHTEWSKAWSTFNRYAQEAAGLDYQQKPDGDSPQFPAPADRWEESKSGKP